MLNCSRIFKIALNMKYVGVIVQIKVKVMEPIAVNGTPISQLWDVTCHMGSPATRHKP